MVGFAAVRGTACVVLTFTCAVVAGLNNGLGLTPQMGYNSWYDVGCTSAMNESTIRATAQALVDNQLYKAGYRFVNLDDCYISERDTKTGKLVPDKNTFPSGMRALSDYIHNKPNPINDMQSLNVSEMKFGVYTDRGDKTCAGRPAALGHEEIDATTYAMEWEIDYLKEDSCNAPSDHATAFAEYGAMRDALNATGRPVFFSLCGWEAWYAPMGATLANSWRVGPDDGASNGKSWQQVLTNIDIVAPLAAYAGPTKGWNDPCLLLSTAHDGSTLLTESQSRAQFSMWAVMAAPLLISGSVINMSPYTLATYSNKEVIKVSQDKLGLQGTRIAGGALATCNNTQASCTNVWLRRLSGQPNRAALVFINAGSEAAVVTCDEACWAAAGFTSKDFPLDAADLWANPNTSALPTILSPRFTTPPLSAHGGYMMIEVISLPHTVPHLEIPRCPQFAVADNFKIDTEFPFVPAVQQTVVHLCHDTVGLHFRTNASDVDIFNSATKCNDPVFSMGDVLEVFVAPVEKIENDPTWYIEIDTAAVSGALWGSVMHNPRGREGPNTGGNATGGTDFAYVDKKQICTAPCAYTGCMMKCSGTANFTKGMTTKVSQGEGWWANDLVIPWGIIPSPLVAGRATDDPWKLWRLDLYRYDYWRKNANSSWDHQNEELSAWSPSGSGNFHTPQFFGSAILI